MFLYFEYITDPIEFVVTLLLKEAKKEEKLIRQIIYTLLGTDTNNPHCVLLRA